jgi:hypothetical protein
MREEDKAVTILMPDIFTRRVFEAVEILSIIDA